MIAPVLFVVIAFVSLLVSLAYQVLPYRFGLPLILLLLGSWFIWVQASSRGGMTQAEVEPLALTLLVGVGGWFAAPPLLSALRTRKRRREANA